MQILDVAAQITLYVENPVYNKNKNVGSRALGRHTRFAVIRAG